MSEAPEPQAKLSKIEALTIGGRDLELARNGAFYLVEKRKEGPYGEPHYETLDIETMPAEELIRLASGLVQTLGAIIVERDGLKRGRMAGEEAK